MAEFDIDVNEPNGRTGIFDLENGQRIKTPNHVPSRADFNYLQHSQFVKPQDYRDIEVGEYACWLDSDQIFSLVNEVLSSLREFWLPETSVKNREVTDALQFY